MRSKLKDQIDLVQQKSKNLLDLKLEKFSETVTAETALSVGTLQSRIFESLNIDKVIDHSLSATESIKTGVYRNLNEYLIDM
jgi:hypothetical protein